MVRERLGRSEIPSPKSLRLDRPIETIRLHDCGSETGLCGLSYDPNNGRRWWVVDGPTEQFVASPVFSAKTGLIYITGGFPDHHILAIQPDGLGNVTRTHITWRPALTKRAWVSMRVRV
jgi:hypothetical protein